MVMIMVPLQWMKNLLKYHKKKIALVVLLIFLFFILLFPYKDLSNLLTFQVSKATQNQVFLRFDKIGLSFLPGLGIKLTDVRIDTPSLPTIQVDQLSIAFSLMKLLVFKVVLNLSAQGLWEGQVQFAGEVENMRSSPHLSSASLKFENINLQRLSAFIQSSRKSPLEFVGQLKGQMEWEVEDPSFKKQPRGQMVVTVTNMQPPSSVSTALGPLALPDIKFSSLSMKVRLGGGQVMIDEGRLGQNQEPMSGQFKGKVGLKWRRAGTKLSVNLKDYELKLDMHVKKSLKSELALFLGFIGKFETKTNDGSRYLFEVSGPNFRSSPNLTSIQKL